MTMSASRMSYTAEYDQMEKAIKSEKGTRVHFGTREAAYTFRLRLNRARQLERKLNAEAFPKGTKMHGASIYDELVFTIEIDTNDEFWVYLQKALVPTHVETL